MLKFSLEECPVRRFVAILTILLTVSFAADVSAVLAQAGLASRNVLSVQIAENGADTLLAVWLQQGEVMARACTLSSGKWGALEKISAAANAKLNTQPGACQDLAAAVDAQGQLHLVWTNGRQLLHRIRTNGVWLNVISRLSDNYAPAPGFPAVTAQPGRVNITHMEDGLLVTDQYDTGTQTWAERTRVAPSAAPVPAASSAVPVPPVSSNQTGPELELTGIEEDSLYLYSPQPAVLYYSGLLEEPGSFLIRGRVKDTGGGIVRLTFSPALGDAPLPLTDFRNGEWSVRYTIKSTDEPATLTITAYDNAGQSTARQIAVIKDTLPPDPPSWVRIWPDKAGVDYADGLDKLASDRQVVVTWTDGQDNESGVRYHVLGTSPRWWQNSERQSGDTAEAQEGENTFYVFAVDNVGNVSLPGTDRVYVDSTPPEKPILFGAVTSADYFYGSCAADVGVMLLNGRPDAALEIISSGNWRYKHDLRDGQRLAVRLQALDRLKNKSPAAEFVLEVDRTPPRIFYAEHNADGRALRVKDKLLVTAKGEANCQAVFRIDGVTADIPLTDTGTAGDARARDNVYTGVYTFTSDQYQGQREVVVTFYDRVGNSAEQKTLRPLLVEPWAELSVDTFEDRGDLYPWKNHLKARNINAPESAAELVQAPEGRGVLRVDYDLNGQQTWAGLSSREFPPRNYYGRRPALQFWLKGSGSPQARLVIQLLPKGARNLGLHNYQNDFTYSAPLDGTEWQKYSVLLPEQQLAGLEQTVRYAVYVYSPEQADRGVFYLDDLKMTYQPPPAGPVNYPPPLATRNAALIVIPPDLPAAPAAEPEPEPLAASPGGAINAPYLSLELAPPVLTRGRRQTLKAFIPPGMSVDRVYAVWGRINQKLQTTRLRPVGGNVFKGEYAVPADLQTGEQQGAVFVQTRDGQLYKKPFYYRVLPAGRSAPAEQITAQFFPQPLVRGKDIRARVNVPPSVQTTQVVLFLSQDQSKVFSVPLNRDKSLSTSAQEIWQGVFVLPEDAAAGEYTANIFCKTQDGGFIKKRIKYSVQ
ncbi:MAG: hypothetical protein LBQ83_02395 [Candidatus Margulisbacteria bacterium]|jgi:hypothetical protein|nr:hypothetical protein [Candidatus Margulisiibacteriota bacterium]